MHGILRLLNKNSVKFGKVRAMGSIGYAIAMLLFAKIYNFDQYRSMPLFLLTFNVLIIFLYFKIPEVPYETNENKKQPSVKQLQNIPEYIELILVLLLLGLQYLLF